MIDAIRNFDPGKAIDSLMTKRAEGDETPALIFQQCLNRGEIDADLARGLCEHAPRLVSMLIDGLYPAYGKLTFRLFVEYAGRGMLTRAVIARAMT